MSNEVNFLIWILTKYGMDEYLLETDWDTVMGDSDYETEKNIMAEFKKRRPKLDIKEVLKVELTEITVV